MALKIVQGLAPFEASANDDDWLGHGVYFWEYAPRQAWAWAERRRRLRGWEEETAVVASMIRLSRCFDLLDPENVAIAQEFHSQYVDSVRLVGAEPADNANHRKYLDCAVFETAYAAFEASGRKIDTCRAVYVPTGSGGRAWKRSWIHTEAHIQLCVREPSCILGTWLVKPLDEAIDEVHDGTGQ